jgi:hypothetical protein
MGTWKKIAEAFGKAANRPGATPGGRDIVYNSNTWQHRPGDVQPRYDDTPAQRAMKKGWQRGRDEYYAARELADEKGLDRTDPKVVERMADEISDRESDAALIHNSEKEWDEAFARRKQGVRDWYGKDYPQDMAEEGAEAFEKQLWEVVDDLKSKGVSAQDILNRIKGND